MVQSDLEAALLDIYEAKKDLQVWQVVTDKKAWAEAAGKKLRTMLGHVNQAVLAKKNKKGGWTALAGFAAVARDLELDRTSRWQEGDEGREVAQKTFGF